MEEERRNREEEGEKGKEENGIGEEKRKVGRPSTESLMREKANSLPLIKMFKRGEKRKERQGEEMKVEVFKRSSKIK